MSNNEIEDLKEKVTTEIKDYYDLIGWRGDRAINIDKRQGAADLKLLFKQFKRDYGANVPKAQSIIEKLERIVDKYNMMGGRRLKRSVKRRRGNKRKSHRRSH
jgi:hypothetical protein